MKKNRHDRNAGRIERCGRAFEPGRDRVLSRRIVGNDVLRPPPRFTQDVDLVVRIKARQVAKFEALFPLEEYDGPPAEVIQDEVLRRGSFNLILQNSGIKVDIVLDKETEFFSSEFARRTELEIAPGVKVFIASPEDLILKKLDYYREGQSEKDLNDIRELLMNVKIDEAYVQKWVDQMGLQNEWKKA